ncbi:hypothetical protein [Rhodoferax ferrireducens]|nr:hypothetical protein [Rhodoferax ferrireducens]WPC68419.1 hypothetical protein SBP18_07930 [Rhodoferax ferrireducens]
MRVFFRLVLLSLTQADGTREDMAAALGLFDVMAMMATRYKTR